MARRPDQGGTWTAQELHGGHVRAAAGLLQLWWGRRRESEPSPSSSRCKMRMPYASPRVFPSAPTPRSYAALHTTTMATKTAQPRPDFVIEFSTELQRGENRVGSQAALVAEYDALISQLRSAGLDVTGRSGGNGSKTALVFVRAKEAKVRAEAHRERCVRRGCSPMSPRP